jgi:hypothetical protein
MPDNGDKEDPKQGDHGAPFAPCRPDHADADPTGPERRRAVIPEPSRASKGRPVPRPVRPRRPVAPQVPPAEETRKEDIREDVKRDAEAVKDKAPDPPVSPGAATGPVTKPAPKAAGGVSAEPWRLGGISKKVSKTTHPGTTQAMSLGTPGDSKSGGFTKHKLRDEDRVNVTIDVRVSYRFVARDAPDRFPSRFQGKLLDISMGGAQIEGPIAPEVSREELKRGSVTIDAEFELPYVDDPLRIATTVNWIKPSAHPRSYLGLRFVGPTPEHRRIIRAFLIGLQSPSRRKFRKGR